MSLLSLVIPMHNESANLDALFARLDAALGCAGMAAEIRVRRRRQPRRHARAPDPHGAGPARLRVVALSLASTEIAVAAGLRFARGDAVVLMDADLQHPPEMIEISSPTGARISHGLCTQRTDRRTETKRRR